ncbi:hypothetical protein OIU77_009360 [Salix suchowensis]|uniref:NAC domain-containing protein n=1 Tax=Salix suchowensis TaxID=1278906 RepID=A0ABQ9AER6_9ROSI|nr:hypothetical protein OIU77_009360 [Salix suchowensis]
MYSLIYTNSLSLSLSLSLCPRIATCSELEVETTGKTPLWDENKRNSTIEMTWCSSNSVYERAFQLDQVGIIHDLPGLPAGVKFDPTDQEILGHLEAKVLSD